MGLGKYEADSTGYGGNASTIIDPETHRSIEPTLEDFAHLMRLRLLARTADNTKADE